MIKKTLLTLVLTVVAMLGVSAAEKNLVITFDNGATQTFLLKDEPAVSVENDKLIVSIKGATTEYTLNTVRTFTFAQATGIVAAVIGSDMQRHGNSLVITGTADVKAYTADGKAVSIDCQKTGTAAVICLDSLPKGLTIIKAAGKTFKYIR